MKTSAKQIFSLCITALFAAILCVLSPLALVLPFTPVPISLGTFAIYLVCAAGGLRKGILSVVVYLLLGAFGLPVFAGYSGGFQILMGPTGGYLIGYLPLALIVGLACDRFPKKKSAYPISMVMGTLFCYGIGTWWLAMENHLSLFSALLAGVIPFLPGDGIKILAACAVAYPIRQALERQSVPLAK